MYLPEFGSGRILRSNLDGSELTTLVRGLNQPALLDLDIAAGKIYWTNQGTDDIRRANLDGSGQETLVTNQNNPAAMTLDVSGGKMYWSNPGGGDIRRAGLDGTGEEVLITGLSRPVFIALDLTPMPEPLVGDFNENGVHDAGDIDMLNDCLRNDCQVAWFDHNGNGSVTPEDQQVWVKDVKHTWFGDANLDGEFSSVDLVSVLQAGKFATDLSAGWNEGDWNGDERFDRSDIIVALQDGGYGQGPLLALAEHAPTSVQLSGAFAAIQPNGSPGDGQTSVVYNAGNGELSLDAPAGVELTSVNIDSAAGIFTGNSARNLGGSFDNDADNNIFKATFGGSFGSLSFGNVAQPGLSEHFVLGDLTAVGSLAGGGDLGSVDLIYVPEPPTIALFAFGLFVGLQRFRRRHV